LTALLLPLINVFQEAGEIKISLAAAAACHVTSCLSVTMTAWWLVVCRAARKT